MLAPRRRAPFQPTLRLRAAEELARLGEFDAAQSSLRDLQQERSLLAELHERLPSMLESLQAYAARESQPSSLPGGLSEQSAASLRQYQTLNAVSKWSSKVVRKLLAKKTWCE